MKRILLIILLLSSLVFGRKIFVKLATLAPEGTDWHGMLIDRGKDGWSSMARTTGLVTLAAVDAALLGLVPDGVHPPEGIPELLELAEARLLQAGVHIERDSFKERPIV